ncbi:MAG: DUF3179 domain-containing (seleno)protein [Candidatus Uhrbacteria bacterium]
MRRRFTRQHFIFFLSLVVIAGIFGYEYFLHRPLVNLPQANLETAAVDIGLKTEILPAINEPVFESVPMADIYLENDGRGIALTENKIARFYPFQILVWHNIVNDVWGRVPILVSYNPLCDNATIFERLTPDDVLLFENSGQIFNNIFLLTDKTSGSLWQPFLGQAISGTKTGQSLNRLASTVMTWSTFKKNFSNGEVLSRETGFTRDYSFNPYNDYLASSDILFPLTKYDSSLPAKTKVFAYDKAVYPEDNIKSAGSIDFEQKIRFVWDNDWQTARGYQILADGLIGDEVALTSGFWFCWAVNN